MRIINCRVLLATASIMVCATSTARAVPLYTFSTLVNFNGTNGSQPYAGVVADASGNLYGTTVDGGPGNVGTVFELAEGSRVLTTLVNFNRTNGSGPEANLAFDSSGNLYGTTFTGGANNNGTVFEIAAGTQAFSTVASFNNTISGNGPAGSLVIDSSGNIFGTTDGGGANHLGTLYEITAATRTLTTLATFNGSNGSFPVAGPIAGGSGYLYGTTENGTSAVWGTVYSISTLTDSLTTLAIFDSTDGQNPATSLIADSSGNLYGTSQGGGLYNDGVVFELPANSHTLTTLYSFFGNNPGGEPEASLIFGANGNLYGTTKYGGISGDGIVFELNPTTGVLTTLYTFNGTDGANPVASLYLDGSGNLYGTTQYGGAYNEGTVFELSPVPEPPSWLLASIGTAGLVFGYSQRRFASFKRVSPVA